METYGNMYGTQVSGYLAKQLLASMQGETLDEPGTDCGSKKTVEVKLTQKNIRNYEYRYIIDGGKLVCLDPEHMTKYIGKTVHMRSPMYCLGDKICNKCAGELEYKMGRKNIGLGCSKLATVLLQMGMKKFHTSAIASKQIELDDMFL